MSKKSDTTGTVRAVDTVAITRILIAGELKRTSIPARGERPAYVKLTQEAILTAGANRPLSFDKVIYEEENKLVEGVYMFPADCFKLTQYGALELNRYADFIRIGDMSVEQESMFIRSAGSMSDLA